MLTPPGPDPLSGREVALPAGVVRSVHDPDDRERLAYLATTSQGRRVYLNRLLTDADVVVPIGRLGYDPVLGYRGPWSLLFPELSDRETARSFRSTTSSEWPDRDQPRLTLSESAEVSWLLGTQFHVGIVAGTRGPAEVIAGLESVVRTDGLRLLDQAWTFEAPAPAELVVVGIGQPGVPTYARKPGRGVSQRRAAGRARRQDRGPVAGRGSDRAGLPPPDRSRRSAARSRIAPRPRHRRRLHRPPTRSPTPWPGPTSTCSAPSIPSLSKTPRWFLWHGPRRPAASWPPAARASSSARPSVRGPGLRGRPPERPLTAHCSPQGTSPP